MGYPRGIAADGRTTWAPHGQTPNFGYLTKLHTKLRQNGYRYKKRDYIFTTDQIEAVKELITDFFEHVPLITARGPNKKTKSIFVKNVLGKTLTLEYQASHTIGNLKILMTGKDGLTREEYYLKTLGDQKLDDSRTLSDYNIQAGQTLLEMGRLRGGMQQVPEDSSELAFS